MDHSLKSQVIKKLDEQGFKPAPPQLQMKNSVGCTFLPPEQVGEGRLWIYFTHSSGFFMICDLYLKQSMTIEWEHPEFLLVTDLCQEGAKVLKGSFFEKGSSKLELPKDTRINTSFLGYGKTYYDGHIPRLLGEDPSALKRAVLEMDGTFSVPEIQRLFSRFRDFEPQSSASVLLYEAKFMEITAGIIEWDQQECMTAMPENISIKDYDEIKNIRHYLTENYTDHIDLQELAQRCYMSKSKLTNLFRMLYGTTIYEYVLTCRMEKAKTLLEDRSMKISEIAFESGYNRQSSFSSIFRQKTGMTPKEYRKQL